MVTLAHPEGELWVVVPKEEWEKTHLSVLDLAQKQVRGQSLREAIAERIAEREKEALKYPMENFPEDYKRQAIREFVAADRELERMELELRKLEETLEHAEVYVEPTEKMAQMTEEYLDWMENRLLHPEPTPVWDSPSA